MIQINDKYFEIYLENEEIQSKINAIASLINKDYEGKEVLFIAVLNGAFMFASDLLKKINLKCEISFIKVSSYEGTASKGDVKELIGLQNDIRNKSIILLEDIVDTGNTIDAIFEILQKQNPESIKTCALLYKSEAFKGENKPTYYCFDIPNKFVVGYGLDYNENGRNLEEIYQINEAFKPQNENN